MIQTHTDKNRIRTFQRLTLCFFALALLLLYGVTMNRFGKLSFATTTTPLMVTGADTGHAFLSQTFPSEIRIPGLAVELLEDGRVFSRDPLTTSEAVRKDGRGAFMIWNDGTIQFSTSDNTNPAENGRTYAIRYPRILSNRAARITNVIVLAGAFLVVLAFGREIVAGFRRSVRILRRNLSFTAYFVLSCLPFFVLTIRFVLPELLWCDEIYTLKSYVINDNPLYPAIFYDYPNNHVLFNLFLSGVLSILNRFVPMHDFASISANIVLVRAATLIFPLLTILFATLSARRFGKNAALIAAVLIASSLPFYAWSTQLRGYGLSMMLLSFMIYLVLLARFRLTPLKGILLSLTTAGLLYTMPFNAIFIAPMMLLLGFDWILEMIALRNNATRATVPQKSWFTDNFKLVLWFIAGIVLAFFLYLPILDQVIRVYAPGGYHAAETNASFAAVANRVIMQTVRSLFNAAVWNRREIAILLGCGLIGIILRSRDKRASFVLVEKYLLLSVVLLVLFCGMTGYFPFNRNILPLLPVLLLVIAGAFGAFLDLVATEKLRIVVVVLAWIACVGPFSVTTVRLYEQRPAYGANSMDQLDRPYYLSRLRNIDEIYRSIEAREQREGTERTVVVALPADFYDYEMGETYGVRAIPDYVGPEINELFASGEPYYLIQTDWADLSAMKNAPMLREPYTSGCVPDVEFNAQFAGRSLYSLYTCNQ